MNHHSPRVVLDRAGERFRPARSLERALDEFAAAVMRASTLDPLTTELVRLRCAQVHDCRLCGSLRLRDAVDVGFDETMTAKIARYETSDLGAAAIAALRLCDSIILAPAVVADGALAVELHRHFTDEQIAEICLDVVKWSRQKLLVALRLESPRSDELTSLSFDEHGDAVIGRPAYP